MIIIMIMGQIFIMIIMILVMIMIIMGKFIGSKWLSWLSRFSWSSRKGSLDMSWPSSWPYAQETSWPFWTDYQGIHYIFTFHFSIKDLQSETTLWNHHDHVAKTSNFYLEQIILITLTIMIEYPTFDDDHDHDMYSAHVNDDSDD